MLNSLQNTSVYGISAYERIRKKNHLGSVLKNGVEVSKIVLLSLFEAGEKS